MKANIGQYAVKGILFLLYYVLCSFSAGCYASVAQDQAACPFNGPLFVTILPQGKGVEEREHVIISVQCFP